MGLTVYRHPEVAARGLCYGRREVALAATAPAQIRAALADLPLARRLLTSPSTRCVALADAIARRTGLRAEADPRLLELDFGAWEGQAWEAIPRAALDHWAADPERRAPPGGESFDQLKTRVSAALGGVEEAIVVMHAGPIRALQILTGTTDFAGAFAAPVPYATAIALPSLEL